ncbi:MAG: threonine/serine exporter family protein [Pirellulaceae bacterium]
MSRLFVAIPDEFTKTALPDGAYWLAFAVAPATFAVLFRVRMSQWPVIYAVSISGGIMHDLAAQKMSAEVAAFAGALTVGCGSNLYARWRDRPALIPSTPGLIVLVPVP